MPETGRDIVSGSFALGECASKIWLAAQLAICQDARRRVARLEKQMIYHIMRTSDVVGPTLVAAPVGSNNTLPGLYDLHNLR